MHVSKVYEMPVDVYGDVRILVRGLSYQCPDWLLLPILIIDVLVMLLLLITAISGFISQTRRCPASSLRDLMQVLRLLL